jgi:hypothetical protein
MYPLSSKSRDTRIQAEERARDHRALTLFSLGAVVAMVLTLLQGSAASAEELTMGLLAVQVIQGQTIGLDVDHAAEPLQNTAADQPELPCLTRFVRRTSDRVDLGYPPGASLGMAVLEFANVLGHRHCTARTGP